MASPTALPAGPSEETAAVAAGTPAPDEAPGVALETDPGTADAAAAPSSPEPAPPPTPPPPSDASLPSDPTIVVDDDAGWDARAPESKKDREARAEAERDAHLDEVTFPDGGLAWLSVFCMFMGACRRGVGRHAPVAGGLSATRTHRTRFVPRSSLLGGRDIDQRRDIHRLLHRRGDVSRCRQHRALFRQHPHHDRHGPLRPPDRLPRRTLLLPPRRLHRRHPPRLGRHHQLLRRAGLDPLCGRHRHRVRVLGSPGPRARDTDALVPQAALARLWHRHVGRGDRRRRDHPAHAVPPGRVRLALGVPDHRDRVGRGVLHHGLPDDTAAAEAAAEGPGDGCHAVPEPDVLEAVGHDVLLPALLPCAVPVRSAADPGSGERQHDLGGAVPFAAQSVHGGGAGAERIHDEGNGPVQHARLFCFRHSPTVRPLVDTYGRNQWCRNPGFLHPARDYFGPVPSHGDRRRGRQVRTAPVRHQDYLGLHLVRAWHSDYRPDSRGDRRRKLHLRARRRTPLDELDLGHCVLRLHAGDRGGDGGVVAGGEGRVESVHEVVNVGRAVEASDGSARGGKVGEIEGRADASISGDANAVCLCPPKANLDPGMPARQVVPGPTGLGICRNTFRRTFSGAAVPVRLALGRPRAPQERHLASRAASPLPPVSRRIHASPAARALVDPEKLVPSERQAADPEEEEEGEETPQGKQLPPPLAVGDLVLLRWGQGSHRPGVILQVPAQRHPRFPDFRSLLPDGRLHVHWQHDVELHVPGWAASDVVAARARSVLGASADWRELSEELRTSRDALELVLRAGMPPTVGMSLAEFDGAVTRYAGEVAESRRLASLRTHFAGLEARGHKLTLLDVAAYVLYGEATAGSGAAGSPRPTPGEAFAVFTWLSRNRSRELVRVFVPGGPIDRTPGGFRLAVASAAHRSDVESVFRYVTSTSPDFRMTMERMSHAVEMRRNIQKWRDDAATAFVPPAPPEAFQHISRHLELLSFTDTERRLLLDVSRALREPRSRYLSAAGRLIHAMAPLFPKTGGSDMSRLLQLARDVGLLHPWDQTDYAREARVSIALSGRETPPSVEEREGMGVWMGVLDRWSHFWARQLVGEPPAAGQITDGWELPGADGGPAKAVAGRPQGPLLMPSEFEHDMRTEIKVLERLRKEVVFPSGLESPSARLAAEQIEDPHAAVRERFSEPVFVIDDPSAHELDDGISISPATDGDANLSDWIDVHIADPTTWLGPDHPLSLLAQLRWTSIYLPNGHLPMLPDTATGKLLDLRDRSSAINGAERFALTFSGRLDLRTGDLADYRVRCTLLNEVRIMHYDTVDDVLEDDFRSAAEDRSGSIWESDLLPKVRPPNRAASVSPEDRGRLASIYELAKHHLAYRTSCGAYQSDQVEYRISTDRLGLPPSPYPYPPRQPAYVTDRAPPPAVRFRASKIQHFHPSQTVVSECMIMAGRIAARFCQDNDVPVLFRGQVGIVEAAQAHPIVAERDERLGGEFRVDPTAGYPPVAELRALVDGVMAEKHPRTGVLPYFGLLKLLPYMPASTVSAEPIAHFSMGLGGVGHGDRQPGFVGYTRATSPLRRYPDMLLHWNVKAVLLSKPPPFTKEDIQKLLARGKVAERIADVAMERTSRFWALEWVRRREVLSRFGNDPMTAKSDPLDRITMPHVDPPSGVPFRVRTRFQPNMVVARNAPDGPTIPGEYGMPPPEIVEADGSTLRPTYEAYVTALSRFSPTAMVAIADLGGLVAKMPHIAPPIRSTQEGGPGSANELVPRYKVGDRVRVVVDEVDPFHSHLSVIDVADLVRTDWKIGSKLAKL
ncbi:hypothetical protein DFJ74DRAFT_359534 [Hyaloraphidium curvatum]|nr:hypothetical protein DFJ74DRAFT_359534 [Hyaloraphidium curvatum]